MQPLKNYTRLPNLMNLRNQIVSLSNYAQRHQAPDIGLRDITKMNKNYQKRILFCWFCNKSSLNKIFRLFSRQSQVPNHNCPWKCFQVTLFIILLRLLKKYKSRKPKFKGKNFFQQTLRIFRAFKIGIFSILCMIMASLMKISWICPLMLNLKNQKMLSYSDGKL